MIDYSLEGVETQPLREFTERAYLNYSMYVILDRALPFIGDGLKPVQRRIVYAMSELGLSATAKYKKSARTVGDVLGKFHPHGDSACYEAMVHMAQPFSYRYTLVDGQGNWGSTDDPKSFAAMRYTESRLSKYAQLLLDELGQGTVDWVPNFDGTLDEPSSLPARLPNLLLNGTTGIAVGMATDVPPHNIKEVSAACIQLLEDPDATIDDICEHIQGPDFPTKAEIITPKQDIKKIYQTGHGSLKMRAVFTMDQGNVVITALPYQVSGAKILEQIAAQMQAKKLPMVEDLRDESDHENPTRLVITPRSNRVDIDRLMSHLFASTDLERSYRVNMNVIGLDRKPAVKNLREMLAEWLDYRRETVRRRLEWRLDKVESRLHILAGLLIAYLNIDEVIHIIRTADEPKPALIKAFDLTEIQAEAILELKLRRLAKLEEMKIKKEQKELEKEQKYIKGILGSKKKLTNLLIKEIKADVETYGDDRISPIVVRAESTALSETELLPSEAITVVLSEKGWVRAAKGHDVDAKALSYKTGDAYLSHSCGKTNQNVVFLDSTGRAYTLAGHSLPSARGQGEPLTGRLSPQSGVSFLSATNADDKQLLVIASTHGYGFIAQFGDMTSKNKAGKACLSLSPNAAPLAPVKIADLEASNIAIVTTQGYLLIFPASELPQLARGKGNKMIGIPPANLKSGDEKVLSVACFGPDQALVFHAGARHLKLQRNDIEAYLGGRGRRGTKLPRGLQKVDAVEVVDL